MRGLHYNSPLFRGVSKDFPLYSVHGKRWPSDGIPFDECLDVEVVGIPGFVVVISCTPHIFIWYQLHTTHIHLVSAAHRTCCGVQGRSQALQTHNNIAVLESVGYTHMLPYWNV